MSYDGAVQMNDSICFRRKKEMKTNRGKKFMHNAWQIHFNVLLLCHLIPIYRLTN